MEESLKKNKNNIAPKVLIRRTNAILLATEHQAKRLAESVLATSVLRLKTENMGTRRTKITVHYPWTFAQTEYGAFFAKYGPVEEVTSVISKNGIATGDMVLQITLTRQAFGEIPNVL